jgi:hypothetical protein
MQQFARSLFLLAWQCGGIGLVNWAVTLLMESIEIFEEAGFTPYKQKLYSCMTRLISWNELPFAGNVS